VNKAWISEYNINKSMVALYRFSQNTWNPLSTILKEEDKDYLYFTAETPGFSPFAISSTEKSTRSVGIFQTKNDENKALNNSNLSEEKQGALTSSNENEKKKSSPGPGVVIAVAGVLVSYAILRRRK
jgi:hypothetical protein